jgi:UDPglucose--hexose-1-phosphate uridylyltransferase
MTSSATSPSLNISTQATDLQGKWELRWHPFREEWVIVAAHRQGRPWVGATVEPPPEVPRYDLKCYLCPGNTRINSTQNPNYGGVYVFDNDFPAIAEHAPNLLAVPHPVYQNKPAQGISRVICYSPRHDLTLAQMQTSDILPVLHEWQRQTYDLGQRDFVQHVLITENRGEVMGMSNAHPHGQIYATNFVWKTVEDELRAMQRYANHERRSLFQDIIAAEQADGRRIVYENEHAMVFAPYFARFAYEIIVAPKRSVPHLHALNEDENLALASAIRELTVRYDNLWRMNFPYAMTIHQAPLDGAAYDDYHAHLQFHPPLRKPGLQKFVAAAEIGGGNFLSDTAPEQKAEELRGMSNVHYQHPQNQPQLETTQPNATTR